MTDVRDPVDLGSADLPDISFNETAVEGRELEYVQEAIRSGHPSSGGAFAERTAALLAEHTGAEEVLMTTSCTAALELSAMLLDLQPGRHRHRAVLHVHDHRARVRPPGRWAGLLRHRARALWVSIPSTWPRSSTRTCARSSSCTTPGSPATSRASARVLEPWPDVTLIEDNAHGLFGALEGQPLGSFGRFAALSFHETKNFVCGEGGALVLNDPADVDRARVLYDKGTNRRAFMLGQVEKYTWKDTGSSFGLADVLAAYLLAQLEQRTVIQAKRRAVHEQLHREPGAATPTSWASSSPMIPPGRESAYHMFYVLLPDQAAAATTCSRRCGKTGVHATFHYLPLHSSDAGRDVRGPPDGLPGLGRHQRTAAAAALLQQPERPGPRSGRGRVPDRSARHACGSSARGDGVHDPARLVLAEPAGLLVAPRPGGTPARGVQPVRRDSPQDARRGQRGCSQRGLDARQPPARDARPVPRGARARRGRVRLGHGPAFRRTRPSTWSAPSTWSSTARTTRWPSPSSRGS